METFTPARTRESLDKGVDTKNEASLIFVIYGDKILLEVRVCSEVNPGYKRKENSSRFGEKYNLPGGMLKQLVEGDKVKLIEYPYHGGLRELKEEFSQRIFDLLSINRETYNYIKNYKDQTIYRTNKKFNLTTFSLKIDERAKLQIDDMVERSEIKYRWVTLDEFRQINAKGELYFDFGASIDKVEQIIRQEHARAA